MLVEYNSESESAACLSAAVRSPLRYPGGKQRAIKIIQKMLPARCLEYREPMVGGGSVYLHAKAVGLAQEYWINDQFEELIAFWSVVQDGKLCAKLQTDLKKMHSSFKSTREIHQFYLAAREKGLRTQYQKALLFFFFNRVTFSGTTRAGGFSKAASISRFTESSIKRLQHLPLITANTLITNHDFEPVIAAPGLDVFMFLDPPYFTASKLYGRKGELHSFDHIRLRDSLRHSSHRFLITYDDCPEVREMYKGWANIVPWNLQYGMNNCSKGNASKIGSELFIANYDIPEIT